MPSMVFHVDDDVYDGFMGRYSVRLAPLFADFAGIGGSQRVLDVGAGTGALAAELVTRLGAAAVAVAEPSPEFTAGLRRRFANVDVRQAPAEDMAWEDGSFDAALAQLVVSFVADPPAAVAEMARLVRPGGVVAVCMWHEDGLELAPPLKAARLAATPPDAPPPRQLPLRTEEELAGLLAGAGLRDIGTAMLEVATDYASFDEFWERSRAMIGPDTAWMREVGEQALAAGRAAAYEALGEPPGAFALSGRAAAARATRA
jgi:SAM-dependent methyltransferase